MIVSSIVMSQLSMASITILQFWSFHGINLRILSKENRIILSSLVNLQGQKNTKFVIPQTHWHTLEQILQCLFTYASFIYKFILLQSNAFGFIIFLLPFILTFTTRFWNVPYVEKLCFLGPKLKWPWSQLGAKQHCTIV